MNTYSFAHVRILLLYGTPYKIVKLIGKIYKQVMDAMESPA